MFVHNSFRVKVVLYSLEGSSIWIPSLQIRWITAVYIQKSNASKVYSRKLQMIANSDFQTVMSYSQWLWCGFNVDFKFEATMLQSHSVGCYSACHNHLTLVAPIFFIDSDPFVSYAQLPTDTFSGPLMLFPSYSIPYFRNFPLCFRAMSTITLPPSSIPLLTTVASFREWRRRAYADKKTVGFVATMGALHDGHLSLGEASSQTLKARCNSGNVPPVRRSLVENDLTVLSIFVNPAQFAPHEDLTTYPRTLPGDLELLRTQIISVPNPSEPELPMTRKASAVFLPSVREMYPSGISQDTTAQKGTFVEVKGYGHQMEGTIRPTFFRGVATVVTKLFNVIEVCKNSFTSSTCIPNSLTV
jgi:hypothetical protein